MDNPFKKIGHPPQQVPPELKKKVMDDVNAYLLFKEVVTLFSSNFSEAVESFLEKREKNRNNNKNN